MENTIIRRRGRRPKRRQPKTRISPYIPTPLFVSVDGFLDDHDMDMSEVVEAALTEYMEARGVGIEGAGATPTSTGKAVER